MAQPVQQVPVKNVVAKPIQTGGKPVADLSAGQPKSKKWLWWLLGAVIIIVGGILYFAVL